MKEGLRLPNANEFSPGQVELRRVLDIVSANEGDRPKLVEEIRSTYFTGTAAKRTDPSARLKQQRTRAGNVLIGLSEYGLFDLKTNKLTTMGQALAATKDESALQTDFSRHILSARGGLEVLKAVRSIAARRERVGKESVDRELQTMGYRLPRATTRHMTLLSWLAKSGVVKPGYEIDDTELSRLMGTGMGPLEDWTALTQQQKYFLRTVRESGEIYGTTLVPSKPLIDRAEIQHGRIFKSDQLAAQVFRPLEADGWITLGDKREGRGGKSPVVAATDKLMQIPVSVLTSEVEWGLPPDLRKKLNTPLDDIRRDLASSSKHVAGIALELLALRVASDLGLTPIKFRLRATQTGGAEVDLIAEGAHLLFSRWLFQAKNIQGSVDLAALAKEIGIAVLLRAHVVVLVTTATFRASVKDHADRLAETTNLQVVLVDGKVLAAYALGGPSSIMGFFHTAAAATMRLKKAQVEAADEESETAT